MVAAAVGGDTNSMSLSYRLFVVCWWYHQERSIKGTSEPKIEAPFHPPKPVHTNGMFTRYRTDITQGTIQIIEKDKIHN